MHLDHGQGHGDLKCFLPLCRVRYSTENSLDKHKVESEQDGMALMLSVEQIAFGFPVGTIDLFPFAFEGETCHPQQDQRVCPLQEVAA